jgi:branched-chain amino acid aminotransferase
LLTINKTLSKNLKPKPDPNKLGFGKYFTDHMFVAEYEKGKGWYKADIMPYGPIILDPAAMVLHYGQAVFEGLKCYRASDGRLLLFRPDMNIKRLNRSGERLCIPLLDEDLVYNAIVELLQTDAEWVPNAKDTSVYIRPFTFATETAIGVHPANRYKFIIILSPVGPYYPEGLDPVSITIEPEYVRSVRGSIGFTKAAANYAISLKGQEKAQQMGYTQVLWLDGIERKYVEEVGTMNVFFKINGEVITPMLTGSILPGVTRDSVIQLIKHWGIPMTERRISVEEIMQANEKGQLEEVFGSGTAAVISPVGELNWHDRRITINNGQIGELSARLYDELTAIQYGRLPDPFGWVHEVPCQVK